MDYHLDDGETGTELMAWLRTRLGEPLPGVVISPDGRPELIAQVHAAGLDFLPKPVKPAALRALLSRPAGKDAKADKTTYVKLHGIDKARQIAAKNTAKAVAAIATLPGDTTFLQTLISEMGSRAK